MRYIKIILCIITLALFIVGCKTVQETSADAVMYYNWTTENISSVNSSLSFNPEETTANLIISDSNREVSIYGVFAIDSQFIYIDSKNLSKIYKFGYEVYENRLELTYNNEVIVYKKINRSN